MEVSVPALRRHLSLRALPFCAQLCLVAIATTLQAGAGAWLATLILGIVSIAAWLRALRTLHTITATPLSRVASAAQGYVALRGLGRALGGTPLLSPLTGLPVLWYRMHIEEKDSDNVWQSISHDESDACLLLEDDSGTCAIDPHGADMHVSRPEVETRGDLRYTHWCLLEHTPLFALGDFHTVQGETLNETERETTRQILADWKHDRPELLRRFDLNRDGELDETEWDLARTEAQREARRQRIEADQAAALNLLKKPRDRRPFIISAVKPWRLKLPHRLWCAWHVAMFLVACAAIAALQQTGELALL